MMTIIFTALVTKIINTPVTALDANIAQDITNPEAALTKLNYLLSAMLTETTKQKHQIYTQRKRWV